MEQFNIQEYLDSGVIELYVLDHLNDAERAAVEKLATRHPEIRKEIAEVEEAMGSYHSMEGLTPPDHVLSNILEVTAKMATPVPESNVTTLPKRGTSMVLPMVAAVVGLALAAWMFIDKQNVQKELTTQRQQAETLRRNAEDISARFQQLEQETNELKAVCCSETAVVKSGKEAIASVYWNKNGQLAHLKLGNLANPGKDHQYQLWAFVDGKPVSVGVIDWDALQKGLVTFSFKDKPQAFAISLEKYGGSPVPTQVKGASEPLQG